MTLSPLITLLPPLSKSYILQLEGQWQPYVSGHRDGVAGDLYITDPSALLGVTEERNTDRIFTWPEKVCAHSPF